MKTKIVPWIILVALFLSCHTELAAQDDYEYWPGTTYNSSVPTVKQVLGYDSGERITSHSNVIKYFETLSKAAPARMKLFDYGESWEGRRLIYAAISSTDNINRLDELKDGMHQLRDSRKTKPGAAQRLIDTLPATVWLAHSIHGNEISSSDAAMMTAFHLLAAQGDGRVDEILKNVVVFINPLQNPDGRDRFLHGFEMAKGLEPDSDPMSAEHDEPWPGGRTNHYLFDLNRDWFILTQPESQGHTQALREWNPLVVVDIHEMGGNSSYFFSPEPAPHNPHFTQTRSENVLLFAQNHRKYFDQFGFDYFTLDIFDGFYPGYGSTFMSYFGSITMLFEQASSRGLIYRRNDGTDLQYRETVRHHFVGSISTAEVAAKNRAKLLKDFYDFGKSAIAEANKEKTKAFVIPKQADQAGANKLAGLLAVHGVEVEEATSSFKAGSETFASGSYLIRTAQPAKRLIHVLLDQNVSMGADFLKEEDRLHRKGLNSKIYDVTSWSLPLMFNIDVKQITTDVRGNFSRVEPRLVKPGTISNTAATVAFLARWGETTAARLLSRALRLGLKVKSSDEPFTNEGRKYPGGSLIFLCHDNPDNLAQTLQTLARETGAEIIGTSNSWMSNGPNFGSRKVVDMVPPKVAILWDTPTSSYSAGNTRFVIERQLGYPVTAIRTDNIKSGNLSRYQVLIMPESRNYADVLGKTGAENLKGWVSKGGTLIGLGSALNYLISTEVGLLSSKLEYAYNPDEKKEKKEDEKKKSSKTPGSLLTAETYRKAITPIKKSPSRLAGFIVKAEVDPDHWLGAGLAKELNVLVRRGDIYTPLRLDKGTNVVRFKAANELLVSGYLYDETREQLAFKPFVMVQNHGRGHVIGFAYSPTHRAYVDGLNMILMNAIFRGAAHSRPLR